MVTRWISSNVSGLWYRLNSNLRVRMTASSCRVSFTCWDTRSWIWFKSGWDHYVQNCSLVVSKGLIRITQGTPSFLSVTSCGQRCCWKITYMSCFINKTKSSILEGLPAEMWFVIEVSFVVVSKAEQQEVISFFANTHFCYLTIFGYVMGLPSVSDPVWNKEWGVEPNR